LFASKFKGAIKVWLNTRRLRACALFCCGIAGSLPCVAVPSHFSSTIGSALLCQDQIDGYFFTDYMNTYFGQPSKTEGGAYWWKVSSTLFGAQVDSIFISQESISSVFIGAIFSEAPDALRENIQKATGVAFKSTNNSERWISPSFSTLLKYNETMTPSKLFCLK
jgi:hypothetical protein